MKKRLAAVGVVCCVLLAILVNQLPIKAAPSCTLYVDSSAGKDGNGTLAQPFNTLHGHTSLTAGTVLCLRGTTSGAPRSYALDGQLMLRGNGTATNPIVLMAYPGEHAAIIGTGDGALDVAGDYWVLQNLAVDNNGEGGAAVTIDGRFAALKNNDIANGRYNGVAVRGADALLESNQIHNFDSTSPYNDANCVLLSATGSRLILRSNIIHDCSGDGFQSYYTNYSPLTVVPTDVQIVNNIFYRGTIAYTRYAIETKIGDRFTITGNDIFGYGYEKPWTVRGGNAPVVLHRYSKHMTVAQNKIHDSVKGVNVYADQGQRPNGITIENNLIYDIPGTLANNSYGIQVQSADNIIILNNSLVRVAGYALRVVTGMNGGRIQNNLVFSSGPSQFSGISGGAIIGNNGFFASGGPASNQAGTNPGFVDPAKDFHLAEGSPAIDAGAPVGLATDFDGKPRVGNPDLGAYEYQGVVAPASSPSPSVPPSSPTAQVSSPTATSPAPTATKPTATSPAPTATSPAPTATAPAPTVTAIKPSPTATNPPATATNPPPTATATKPPPTATNPPPTATNPPPTATATAPTSGAQPMFSSASPWNVPIAPNAQVDPNSPAMIAQLFTSHDPRFWINLTTAGVTIWYADASTPRYFVKCSLGNCSDLTSVPIPNGAVGANGSDGHMTIIDQGNHMSYDFYRPQGKQADGTWLIGWGTAYDLSGNGVKPRGQSSATAAGFSLLSGLIRPAEITAGHINHALLFSYDSPGPCLVYPASTNGGSSKDARAMPMGARLQLDPTLDVNTLGLSPGGTVIARALQEYGMIVGDNGQGISIYGESFYGKSGADPWSGLLAENALVWNLPASRLRVLKLPGTPDCALP